MKPPVRPLVGIDVWMGHVKISDGTCRNALMPGGVNATGEPKLRPYGGCTNEIREYSHLRASLLAACSTALVSSSAMTWVAEEVVLSSMG